MFGFACGCVVVALFCFGFLIFGHKLSNIDNSSDFLSSFDSVIIGIISVIGVIATSLSVMMFIYSIGSWFGG